MDSPCGQNANQPVAIIGMGVRLPGGISSDGEFWKFLINKQSGRQRVPKSRYNINGFHHAKSGKENVSATHGYFLDDRDVNLKAIDSSFFVLGRGEMEAMDPQQRLLLEVMWECIESAGQTNLEGSKTGVYVGSYGEDWNHLKHHDTQDTDSYRPLGTGDFALSNALSYHFDLRGPSMTLRTACSAAMNGLHLACQALASGDCDAAFVAGSSIILSPYLSQDMTAKDLLSPDGVCRTFDADANGYARAEGVGVILVKPLQAAINDNDPIRAVIRATAVNSDGKTTGMGVPSPICHEAMIRGAYEAAGIQDVSRTAFIECHGTGTTVGDPLETMAVGNIFGDAGIHIGSVRLPHERCHKPPDTCGLTREPR